MCEELSEELFRTPLLQLLCSPRTVTTSAEFHCKSRLGLAGFFPRPAVGWAATRHDPTLCSPWERGVGTSLVAQAGASWLAGGRTPGCGVSPGAVYLPSAEQQLGSSLRAVGMVGGDEQHLTCLFLLMSFPHCR